MTSLNEELKTQIASLTELSREELIAQWIKCFGSQPYKGIREKSLIRGIAYHIQAKTHGALKRSTSRQLLKLANGLSGDDRKELGAVYANRLRSKLGSRLVREWNGRTYEVVVVEKGYLLNGNTHASLSACAKAITGAHWSGPRFFGVAS